MRIQCHRNSIIDINQESFPSVRARANVRPIAYSDEVVEVLFDLQCFSNFFTLMNH